jgi:AcrR family transcriptional regulator
MPRTPEKNKIIKDKRRAKIMKTSLKLFALEGYNNISVDDITKAAKCSHGLFYHYFNDKEDVYSALMKEKEKPEYDPYHLPTDEAVKAGGLAGIKIVVEYARTIISGPDEIIYYNRLNTMDHEDQKGEDIAQTYYKDFVKLVIQGQKDGTIRPGDPEEIADSFFDICNGAIARRLYMGEQKFRPISVETMMRLFEK